MWIPRPAYEAMPYASVAIGAALLAAAFLVERVPHGTFFAAGGIFVVLGLVLWMKRRDYRSNASVYDPRSLDD